jgi:tRNA pseudouridine32 synthase/23S rRNA pseudouridine746 synthase
MAESIGIGGLSRAPGDGTAVGLLCLDPALLVADKPAGLLSVPGRGVDKQDCLSARLQALHPEALVVHRLDMATSGLFLMARGPAMQQALSRAFEQRQVHKRYEAVVAGELSANDAWQVIELPVGADWPNRPRQQVDAVNGRPATTRWQALGPGPLPGTTRLLLEPVTGRTHQLRVHLQAIGHPIVGDALYAPPAIAEAAPRLLLHATELALPHPATGEPSRWTSPSPF